jgi:hypothetical protein
MQQSLRAVEESLKCYENDVEVIHELIAVCRDMIQNGYQEDILLAALRKVETTYVANIKKS